MRGDLQVDKGNRVGWGFAERGWPDSEKGWHGGDLHGVKFKEFGKDKHEHPCSILFDSAVIRGQARLSGPNDQAGRGLNWHRHIRAGNQGHR